MTKLIKTSNEVQVSDFGKALGEAFERVEKRPKKKRKKKANIRELVNRVTTNDILIAAADFEQMETRAIAQRIANNPAWDPGVLVQSGRTSSRQPNIANPPRRGDVRRDGSAPDDDNVMTEFPISTAVERLIDAEADARALARRESALASSATSMFLSAEDLERFAKSR